MTSAARSAHAMRNRSVGTTAVQQVAVYVVLDHCHGAGGTASFCGMEEYKPIWRYVVRVDNGVLTRAGRRPDR